MRDSATVPVRPDPIAFIDLQAQRARISERINAAIQRVLDHGHFIMGPEVLEIERKLAAHCGAKHVITTSNGTSALLLALMAREIGRGDAVFVPSFTFTATAEVVVLLGATPVFVDVLHGTYNMDPVSLENAISVAKKTGLKPTCVIPVDLFGQPVDFDAVQQLADAHDLWILDDAAQSYGATYKDRKLGTCADATATSFYPSKPLGCYGDGGAVFTDDDDLAERVAQVRVHGQGRDRNENVRIGVTARFDSIQAAVLLEKLAIFDDECTARNKIAARYTEELKGVVTTPIVRDDCTSVWAQYTITSPRRDRIATALQSQNIPTAMFYPRPIHTQAPYRGFPSASGGLPVTEQLAQETLSLPMHPYLDTDAQGRVIAAVRAALQ
jgi:dTDP-4-amino-4,6-dideoxygalactose transaminase